MEDRMCVIEDLGKYIENPKLEGFLFLAVFDGHQGFHCSQFLQTYIPYIFSECAEENFDEEQIKCGLEELDQAYLAKCEIEGYTCGSTALVAIISKSKLYSAWLGDCEAHLIEEEFKSVLPVVKPHKLSDPEERKLLEAKGSNVVFVESSQMYRLNAQLAVSRSIGDIFHKNQMIREPSTKQVDNLENYRYLVMACDGIFDVIRGEELSEILNSNSLDVNSNIAEYIVKLSIARKSGDNLSAIVLNLNKYMKS
ncbi:MAG: Protein phosphatase 1E [Marteilia pararefringens]